MKRILTYLTISLTFFVFALMKQMQIQALEIQLEETKRAHRDAILDWDACRHIYCKCWKKLSPEFKINHKVGQAVCK